MKLWEALNSDNPAYRAEGERRFAATMKQNRIRKGSEAWQYAHRLARMSPEQFAAEGNRIGMSA